MSNLICYNDPINGRTRAPAVLRMLSIDLIDAGKYQVREEFDSPDHGLAEMADTIHAIGTLQPIVVRKASNGRFELISGERRFRASMLAGLQEVEVIERDMNDREVAVATLVENIVRKPLNVFEEALGYSNVVAACSGNQSEAARVLGAKRPTLANKLRLLELGAVSIGFLKKKQLDEAHAKALLMVKGDVQDRLANESVKKKWSVKELLIQVHKELGITEFVKPAANADYVRVQDPDVARYERMCSEAVGQEVSFLRNAAGKWRVQIDVVDDGVEQLDGVIIKLLGRPLEED